MSRSCKRCPQLLPRGTEVRAVVDWRGFTEPPINAMKSGTRNSRPSVFLHHYVIYQLRSVRSTLFVASEIDNRKQGRDCIAPGSERG